MSDVKSPVVRLSPVKTAADVRKFAALLEDDWWALDLDDAPSEVPGLHMRMVMGKWAGRFIHALPEDKIVGVVILDTSRRKIDGVVELDIAITDKAYRGKRLSMPAMALAFDEYLFGGLCPLVWGWINANNKASIAMAESLGIPIVGRLQGERISHGKPIDTVELEMSLESWKEIRPKIAAKIGIPLEPEWPKPDDDGEG